MLTGVIVPMGGLAPEVPHDYQGIRALVLRAEAGGLDSVWVYDHLLAEGTHDAQESPWEAWTLLTALAEATERVRLGALVLCTSFRNAGVLARMADTFQEVSGGRLVLGIGSGWHRPEYDAFGLPFAGRVDGFEEAAKILAGMLRQGRATVEGRHHRVADAPVRLRDGRQAPEILIAAKGPRMLDLTARYADAWNLAWFGRPDQRWRRVSTDLDRACAAAGRDPATLRRTAGVLVRLTPPEPAEGVAALAGTPQAVADGLHAWAEEGVDEVILNLDPATPAAMDLVVAGMRRYRG
ncbi:MAG TPA: LLM class flavin-dependent oxidoreductase [Dermatophilaceae bacterium]|nr:LLM class flavin-dependent oxidoreductase [Dermatophilaceae bacterium]